jgi:hypothetical protein
MKYPARVQQIIDELARKNPDLVAGDDEARRRLTMLFAQQARFELGPNWGTKRASPTRPLSADAICTQDPFVGWDTQIAGGVIAQFPESIDLAGQVFVPVDPVDHLRTSTPPVSEPTGGGGETTPPAADRTAEILAAIQASEDRTREQIQASERRVLEALQKARDDFNKGLDTALKQLASAGGVGSLLGDLFGGGRRREPDGT